MKNDELIKQCRYYKGEAKNPFEQELFRFEVDKSHLPPPECMKTEYNLPTETVNSLSNQMMFWFYEQRWIEFNVDDPEYLNRFVEELKVMGCQTSV